MYLKFKRTLMHITVNEIRLKHLHRHFIYSFIIFSLTVDDHSRVILKTAASNNEGYINANYIEASTS